MYMNYTNTLLRDFNTSHRNDGYVLFPSKDTRQFWTYHLARECECVRIDAYITLYELQQTLCEKISRHINIPLRYLTFEEHTSMLLSFLCNDEIKKHVEVVENVREKAIFNDMIIGSNSSKDMFAIEYVEKLSNIFSHYPLFYKYKRENDALYHSVFELLRKYSEFLLRYKSIDVHVLSFILYEGTHILETLFANSCKKDFFLNEKPILTCCVLEPLFSPSQRLWYAHCIKKNILSSYVDSINIKKSKETFQYLKTYEEKIFPNTVSELHAIASHISLLLHDKKVSPSSIALTLCENNVYVMSWLCSLASQYNIPFSIQESEGEEIMNVLQMISECVETNMHPEVLCMFFFHSSLQWKNRDVHICIVDVGMKYNCIDDACLSRWKMMLEKDADERVFEYFMGLYKNLKKIVQAQTTEELRENIIIFGKQYLDNEKLEDSSKSIIAQIQNVINRIVIYDNYRKRVSGIEGVPMALKSPWNLICHIAKKWKTMVQSKTKDVKVFIFPQSTGTYFKHHFFATLSQKALTQTSSHTVIVNEYRDSALQDNEVVAMRKETMHYCREHIKKSALHVYCSTSSSSFNGKREFPLFFEKDVNHVEDDKEYNEFFKEKKYWEDCIKKQIFQKKGTQHSDSIHPHFMLIKDQVSGMRAQQYTKRKSHRTMYGASLNKDSADIIKKRLATYSISAGDVAYVMTYPMFFMVEKVFGIVPLFNTLHSELGVGRQMLGSIMHNMLRYGMYTAPNEGFYKERIQQYIRKYRPHFLFIKMLKQYMQSTSIHSIVREIRKFFLSGDFDVKNIEEKQKNTICNLFGVEIECAITGIPDLVLIHKQTQHIYIVDYKLSANKKQNLRHFSQLWMYHMLIRKSMAKESNVFDSEKSISLFFLKENSKNIRDDKELQQYIPCEKDISIIQNYKTLFLDGLANIIEGNFKHNKAIENLYSEEAQIAEGVYISQSILDIFRDSFYIYPNKIHRHTRGR